MSIPVKCKFCYKTYASQSSRSNHVKKYHNNEKINKNTANKLIIYIKEPKKYYCEKCKKGFNSYYCKWRHQKDCKNINNTPFNTIPISIPIPAKKFICNVCKKKYNNFEKLKNHIEIDCKPSINSNNIYTYQKETFGKNKYTNGGDIYIIQTDFNCKGYYKIGVTNNLPNRMRSYRCGAVLEPKIHYYYPCKNIKEADFVLKKRLNKFNIKREIYQADNLEEIRNIIKQIQKENNCEALECKPKIENDILGCLYCDLYFTNEYDLNAHKILIHEKKIQEKKLKFTVKELLSIKDLLEQSKKLPNLMNKLNNYFLNKTENKKEIII